MTDTTSTISTNGAPKRRSTNSTRSRWAAIGAAVAVTIGAIGFGGLSSVSAEKSSGDRPVFVPINPCRLIDTRPAPQQVGPRGTKLGVADTLVVAAHGSNGKCTGPSSIPTDALALSMNVTALGATSQSFLTFWGSGPNPGTANLNPAPGEPPTPNSVSTPLSSTGSFNVYNDVGAVDVVIDVNGYYVHHTHADLYATVDHTHSSYVEKDPSLTIPHTAFEDVARAVPIDGRLVGSGFLGSSMAQCMLAALPVNDGMSISSVSVRGYTIGGSSNVSLNIVRVRHAPGTGLSAADLTSTPAMGSLTTTGTGTINEGVVTPSTPIVVDTAVDTYYITTCSNTAYVITGAVANVTYS